MNNNAKIACCNICLLAEKMKVCAECPFNPSKLKLTAEERETVVHKELLTVKKV